MKPVATYGDLRQRLVTEMATLIADLRAAGGVDPMPTFRERMAENYRQPSRRPASSTK